MCRKQQKRSYKNRTKIEERLQPSLPVIKVTPNSSKTRTNSRRDFMVFDDALSCATSVSATLFPALSLLPLDPGNEVSVKKYTLWRESEGYKGNAWVEATQAPTRFSHAVVSVFPTIWEPGTGYNLGQKGLRIFENGGYFTHYALNIAL